MNITIEEIKKLIPHRDPFLFIENCQIVRDGKEGIGEKLFSKDEYFFRGHFPNKPIVPGVVLVEAMAQTAGIVISKKYEQYKEKTVLFMSISKAKFRKPVFPENKIIFHVKFLHNIKSVYKFSGEAYRDEIKVCESEFSAMITYKDL